MPKKNIIATTDVLYVKAVNNGAIFCG